MPESIDLSALLQTAQDAATRAGSLARESWHRPRRVSRKGYRDLVTDTDLASQELISGIIRERFPTHGFLTEENDPTLPAGREVTWIIDPVDGTSNFSRGIPNYCISVAAALTPGHSPGSVLVGVIYDPERDELFSAAEGRGSYLNGREISVSPTTELGDAVVGVDWSRSRPLRQATLEAIASFAHHVHTLRAIGSAALALAWVAAGRLDLYLNRSLMPWDVASADLLIREAGGAITDLTGSRLDASGMSGACIASNGQLHHSFLNLLS